MNGPRITRMNTKTGSNEELTNRAVTCFTVGTSLLCVSTAGRKAGSAEPASAFTCGEANRITRMTGPGETPYEQESAKRLVGLWPGPAGPTPAANRLIPKKRHPAFAGRRAGDAITGGVMAMFLHIPHKPIKHKIGKFST